MRDRIYRGAGFILAAPVIRTPRRTLTSATITMEATIITIMGTLTEDTFTEGTVACTLGTGTGGTILGTFMAATTTITSPCERWRRMEAFFGCNDFSAQVELTAGPIMQTMPF
jgi:hypothetical protein